MNPMQMTLGQTGIATSALALGCARLGSALTPLSKRECLALIDEAYALGVRHFDTASVYGQGDSERYLGEALQGRREQVCLSTKAGQRLSAAQSVLARFKTPVRWLAARRGRLRHAVADRRALGVPRCFEPDYIERSLHESLQRLRTDHVDLFYLHSPDAAVLGEPLLMARIERMRREGLFRAFGVSCDEPEVAIAAAAHAAVQVVQFAFDEGPQGHALLAQMANRGKVAVLRGLVQPAAAAAAPGGTATAQDGDTLLSERFGRTLAVPALGGVIVGTTNRQHLRDNVAAFERAERRRAASTCEVAP